MLNRAETEFDFYSRRAMEEAQAAATAASRLVGGPIAGWRLRDEQETDARFKELLDELEVVEANEAGSAEDGNS